ncbi:hypothetical protein EDC96DRAFT_607735 [Choanephora cucurbitarum]|nr:hypothetical protein EDC96DRAFT_607735 [Choanephora cucurbitarum]
MHIQFCLYLSMAMLAISMIHAAPNAHEISKTSLTQHNLHSPYLGPKRSRHKRASPPSTDANDKWVQQIKQDPAVQSVIDFLIQSIITSMNQPNAEKASPTDTTSPAKEEEADDEEGGPEP